MIREDIHGRGYGELHHNAVKSGIPLRVLFELTYRCNFNCVHCAIPRSRRLGKELDTAEVKTVIRGLAALGCVFIGLTGGEVFLRPDSIEIIAYCRSLGMQVVVLTNGSLIDEAAAAALSGLSLNKVDVSLHALSSAGFSSVCGVRGQAAKVKGALSLFKKYRIPFALKSCAMNINRKEIPALRAFASRLGVAYRVDYEILPGYDHCAAPLAYDSGGDGRGPLPAGLSAGEIAIMAERARREIIKRFRSRRFFYCNAGTASCAIDPYGNMKICHQIASPVFSTRDRGVEGAWDGLTTFVKTLRAPEGWRCESCELLAFCSWCPGRSFLYTGGLFSCPSRIRAGANSASRRFSRARRKLPVKGAVPDLSRGAQARRGSRRES